MKMYFKGFTGNVFKNTAKTEIPLVFPEGDQDGKTKLFRIKSERSNKTLERLDKSLFS